MKPTTNLRLESQSNAIFKKFLSLTTSKGIKEHSLFLLSGEKLVREFLQKPNLKVDAEIIPDGSQRLGNAGTAFTLSSSLFKQLDVVGTHFNILVLQVPKIEFESTLKIPSGLQIICPLGDPGNLGSVLRSAEAFAISRVILTEESANPFLPKAVKASAGSCLRIQLIKTGALKTLANLEHIALDQGGDLLSQFTWPKNSSLVIGEEGPGLKGLEFKYKVTIPIAGVESLNAVVATSIALYDYSQKSKTRN